MKAKIIFAAVAIALGGLVYLRFFAAPPQMPAFPPPAVTVLKVKTADVPLIYEYAGRTAGSREVEIRARVNGILEKRAYEEGSWVEQGQLLFRIDPKPFQAEQAQAEARLSQAANDWRRAQALSQGKAISAREYDEAHSQFEQARAEAQTARINLGYTTVTAPISGVTSKEGLSEGSLVTADNSLLTRLAQFDPIYVEFAYPDSDALAQKRLMSTGEIQSSDGQKLQAEMEFGEGNAYKEVGSVDFTDSVVDPTTSTVHARAIFPNPDKSVLPGQFVRLKIKGLVRKNAVSIPDQAVMQGAQGTFVYVVNSKGYASMQPIILGDVNNGKRIVTQGLKPGDKVIIEGMIKVHPDAPVTITPPNTK